MPKIFALHELVRFAVEIEKDGIAFYNRLAEQASDATVKELYQFLVAEEVTHQAIFEALLAEVGEAVNPGESSDKYHQYMHALVESAVFKKDDPAIQNLVDDAEILEYAIGKEKESILFYQEMKGFVPEQDKPTVEKIIEEERFHVIKLLDMKEKVG